MLIAALVAILLVICSGIALAAGDDPEAGPTEPATSSAPPAEPGGPELAGERTATSQTFLLPDGARETRVYETPVNYRDEGGQWQPIDEGLQPLPGGALVNGDNRFDLRLPERMGDGSVRLALGDQWVSYKLLGEETETVELDSGTATYESKDPGVAFQLDSFASGVKEDIVLSGPDQPSSFHFQLDASPGLIPSVAEDGSLEFRDADDHLFALLPAPTISDSSHDIPVPTKNVSYGLESKDPGSWRLTVAADAAWLAEPGRVWPATIDPTLVTVGGTVLDCTIGSIPLPEGWRNCGTTGHPELLAAYSQKENQRIRTLIGFNFSAIPKNAYITAATASLYAPAAAENTPLGLEARNTTTAFNQDLTWSSTGTGAGKDKWITPGGDYGTRGAEILTSQRGSQAGWWNFASDSLTELVGDWVSGESARKGLLIRQINESKTECEANPANCNRRYVAFSSSAVADASKRPKLTVNWYPAAPSSSKVTLPSEGTVTARRLKLQSAWMVAGVTGMTYQYREKGKATFKTIPPELVKDESGAAVTWPMPTNKKQESKLLYFDAAHATPALRENGGSLQIRALFYGVTGGEGFSAPAEATVNRFIGGSNDATAQVGPGSVNLLTGNFTLSQTDVSIPGFDSSLEFSRTFNSRAYPKVGNPPVDPGHGDEGYKWKGVLGPGWEPGLPVEAAGGAAWRSVRLVDSSEVFEGETYTYSYAVLTDIEGVELGIKKQGNNFVMPPEAAGWALTSEASDTRLVLADPAGNRTTFEKGANGEYLPVSVSQLGGAGNKTQMVYEIVGGRRRLKMAIAPAAEGQTCNEATVTTSVGLGCRTLVFTYAAATNWGAPSDYGDRLALITYYGPETGGGSVGSWPVAKYCYNSDGRLTAQWDPRLASPGVLCASPPPIRIIYTYDSASGALQTIKPPGEEPWTLEYGTMDGELSNGRLVSVKRPSLISGTPVAQTTLAYGVPTTPGSGGPYDLSGSAVTQWGQHDIPVEATAIFPPDQVPASPPSSYSRATLYYMDADGRLVNTATPSGAGTTAPSITTVETDKYGNVIRELTAQNRLRSLAAGTESIQRSEELATERQFSSDGTELREEWGPAHWVRIAETEKARKARLHKTLQYDNPAPPAGTPAYHLPTRETIGASIDDEGIDADQRITETGYNWTFRKPNETVIDPTGLNLRTRVLRYANTGLTAEYRLPGNPEGGDARTTKTIYYSAQAQSPDPQCQNKPAYAQLPCKTMPAAQPSTPGQPQVLVTRIASYNPLGSPTEVIESPGESVGKVRKTLTTYDSAGRVLTVKQEGGGTPIPKSETVYNGSTGLADTQRFKCEEANCGGFDDQAVTATYDSLGRVTAFQDADGNTATTTYDLLGRQITTNDGKGTQTRVYDAVTGLLTELHDSAAGTFTASYNADGAVTEQGFPNGLVGKTAYDETGTATQLSYVKTTMCSLNCTWLDFSAEESIHGQVLGQSSSLSSQQYSYDKAGRLTQVLDTPQEGSCVTREYVFGEPGAEEAAGRDSNRTKLITRNPGLGAICDTTSAGATQSYSYDAADRLLGTGLVYDDFGRITSLSADYAGGKELSSSYFSNDMLASQSQGGVTNTFQLDALGRQRQRVQAGGLLGTEVFHYANTHDAPSWTIRGSSWMRNITGIGGDLAAIQDSSAGVALQLTNLHGDIVATASLSQAATKPTATFEFDEFGNPKQAGSARFGWLGGKSRRTELPSGVVQMGARSYVPAMGRFISTDPMMGGSANSYDYGNADPVNNLDVDGMKAKKGKIAVGASRMVRPGATPQVSTSQAITPSSPIATASYTPRCESTATVTDIKRYGPWGVGAFHAVSVAFVWSCGAKVTVYAWAKVGGVMTPPQPYGNAKAGQSVIAGIPYVGAPYKPVIFCIKFFYARDSVKSCGVAQTVYEAPL